MPVLSYDSPFQKHLRPGEQLRWVGRPRQGWRHRWLHRGFLLQIAGAVVAFIWLAKFAKWCLSAAGIELALPLAPPTTRLTLFAFAFVSFTTWHLFSERRRRAGTWYAVTDRRVLFVLTSVRPESVVGVELDELSQVSLNAAAEFPGPTSAVILKLKQIDPYMAGSGVLGYQMASNAIFLEDLEDPKEFVDQIVAARLAPPIRWHPVSVRKSFDFGSGTSRSFGDVALTLTPLPEPGTVRVTCWARQPDERIRQRATAYAKSFLSAYVTAYPQFGFSVVITAVERSFLYRNHPGRAVDLALHEAIERLKLPPVPSTPPPEESQGTWSA